MDEEALKRNTDCVYFLASPLTCKKGVNCEFRHSEAARLHLRECWYWLGGNCRNAECPFRHLPLDGRPASALASASASYVPSKATAAPATSTLMSLLPEKKLKTPCHYFSQGYCSRGNRCAFYHGSLSSKGAQTDAAQKLPGISACKGPETNDTSSIKNGTTIQTTMMPSYAFVPTQKRCCIDPPPESLQKCPTVSLTSLNGETPIIKMSRPSVRPKIQSNLPSSHGKSKDEQHCQDPTCTGVEHVIETVKSAETKQFSQGKQGTWRERLLKDEPDDLFYSKDNGYLPPHFIMTSFSPKRTACYQDAHDFEWEGPEMCDNMPLSPDVESYEWPPQVHTNHCQQRFSNLRRCDYLARDRYRIYNLRDHLPKQRISYQGQFSGFGCHVGSFEDHWRTDERNWIDSAESALSDNEKETSLLNFKGAIFGKIQPPVYDYGWDAEKVNAEISSVSLDPMCLTRHGPRSEPYHYEDEWYNCRKTRCHLGSGRGRPLWTRPGTSVNVVGCFQTEGETHSGLFANYVARPTIKSQIISASGYDWGQVNEALNDFEVPKLSTVLLQKKPRVI
ncbi:hypothetical protein GOP47_0023992 [Adiantum capillus-veneris]|uniref:C3H1-type domain-containing protein n=1 Tax=Adiantum capillus-veneris TaxID=13818 RepID=A0A9D4U4Z9_ADICA|nr:hypothetical protein GOP47_0023992 [Adiantum capillus-veneris]